MNRTALKIAASTMVVGLTMVACATQSDAMRRRATPAAAATPEAQAATFHEQAMRAIRQGQIGAALTAMEEAVALSPRDAGYRMLLADIYMKSGRFESARTTYGDVLELDPGHTRASLSFALMHIALGRPQAAVAQLDQLHGRASAADIGLAYALAGLPERAIEILEPAARGFDATPRLRQNLALSYALAGNWRRARAVAAQDVSPAELGARLQQWAAFAHPDADGGARMASLLGVNPVSDPGQPVRLALNPAPAPVQVAEAPSVQAPAPVQVAEAPPVQAPAPIQLAEAAPVSVPAAAPAPVVEAPAAAPAPAPEAEPSAAPEAPSYYLPPAAPAPADPSREQVAQAAAVRSLTQPTPAVVRTASVSLPAPVFRRQAPAVRPGNSRFVVQLGAYGSEAGAEAGWVQLSRRFALSGRAPLTTTFTLNGRTMHRVSVAGFASQGDAQRFCSAIKARGGACFVRANAGDASVRWAARYGRSRQA